MSAPKRPATPARPRTLDVRALIARGEEPFPQVLGLVRSVAPGEEFVIVTPFIPAPLIERLRAEGYAIRPELVGDGSWRTHFVKPAAS